MIKYLMMVLNLIYEQELLYRKRVIIEQNFSLISVDFTQLACY